ncbi:MAG: phosphatidate cytidylyltransferase [Pseudomonadota bacterium]
MIAAALLVTASLFALGATMIALFARRAPRAADESDPWALYRSELLIVAAVLVPAALHPAVLVAVLAAAAARWSWEVFLLYRSRLGMPALVLCLAAGTAAALAGYLLGTTPLLIATAGVLAAAAWPAAAALRGRAAAASPFAIALGFPLLCSAHVAALAGRENAFAWIFLLFAAVEAQDAFAWLAGRLFGRTPILRRLSPRKTLEGALAGLAAGGATALLVARAMLGLEWPLAGALAALLAAAGFAGDLFASALKRAAGAKDFARVHPLHGGLLDIYDSFLFAAVPLNAALWAAGVGR